MKVINRGVVIVKPKQPFLDWLGSLPDPADTTLEYLREDSTVFLIPGSNPEDFDHWLERNYSILFEQQLAGWWTGEADWPSMRDLHTFRAWFDVDIHTLAIDLGPERIMYVDL